MKQLKTNTSIRYIYVKYNGSQPEPLLDWTMTFWDTFETKAGNQFDFHKLAFILRIKNITHDAKNGKRQLKIFKYFEIYNLFHSLLYKCDPEATRKPSLWKQWLMLPLREERDVIWARPMHDYKRNRCRGKKTKIRISTIVICLIIMWSLLMIIIMKIFYDHVIIFFIIESNYHNCSPNIGFRGFLEYLQHSLEQKQTFSLFSSLFTLELPTSAKFVF